MVKALSSGTSLLPKLLAPGLLQNKTLKSAIYLQELWREKVPSVLD